MLLTWVIRCESCLATSCFTFLLSNLQERCYEKIVKKRSPQPKRHTTLLTTLLRPAPLKADRHAHGHELAKPMEKADDRT